MTINENLGAPTIACREYNADFKTCGAGKYESVAFKSETLCEMEGISLRKEGTNVVKYSLWMDGEPINKYSNRKTAVEMFLDFCGVPDRKRKALEKALMAV